MATVYFTYPPSSQLFLNLTLWAEDFFLSAKDAHTIFHLEVRDLGSYPQPDTSRLQSLGHITSVEPLPVISGVYYPSILPSEKT